jgi:uncharacterized protein (TIGR02646 family)
MIFIDRDTRAAPSNLLSHQEREVVRLTSWFQNKQQRLAKFVWPPALRADVLHELKELFHGKCAYCERPAGTIDTFRPKQRAKRLDKSISPDHYWWLASDWNNLYLCCHECNARKGTLFPIEGDEAAPLTFGKQLQNETPLLLDPCTDIPDDHLLFLDTGFVEALTDKGVATIQVFRLNDDPYLVAARRERAKFAQAACQQLWQVPDNRALDATSFVMKVMQSFPETSPHLGVVRAIATFFVRTANGAATTPPPIATNPDLVASLPEMVWLKTIEIDNIRTITNLKIEFPENTADETGQQPWLMMLGENSVGKSTLLQAVAIGLMPDQDLQNLHDADKWITQSKEVLIGTIRLTFTNGTTREVSAKKGTSTFIISGSVPAMPVLAYGSTRLLPKSHSATSPVPSAYSVTNLFEQTSPLANLEPYLCQSEKVSAEQFELFAGSLLELLPVDSEARIKRSQGRLKTTVDGVPSFIDELSDGYKSVCALAMDIMYHLSGSTFDMTSAHGLVMVDEVELHLHPRWKIRVVDQLRKVFPNVRFIVTTHDPLCVHGVKKGELHVVAKHPNDKRFICDQYNVPPGTRVDEVLTGPCFGLPSTIDEETQQLMSEHGAILRHPNPGESQQRRRRELEHILLGRMQTGSSRVQRAVMAVAALLHTGGLSSHADLLIQNKLNKILALAGGAEGEESDV